MTGRKSLRSVSVDDFWIDETPVTNRQFASLVYATGQVTLAEAAPDVDQYPDISTDIDLFSRRVVGWSMSATMIAQLAADAPIKPIWRRDKPDALLRQLDQRTPLISMAGWGP